MVHPVQNLLYGRPMENNIVHEDHKPRPYEVAEQRIYKPLKSSGGIAQSIGHDLELIETTFGTECSLFPVRRTEGNLSEPTGQVYCTIPVTATQGLQTIVHVWEGVAVLDCDTVKFTIIDAESQRSIFLMGHHYWC